MSSRPDARAQHFGTPAPDGGDLAGPGQPVVEPGEDRMVVRVGLHERAIRTAPRRCAGRARGRRARPSPPAASPSRRRRGRCVRRRRSGSSSRASAGRAKLQRWMCTERGRPQPSSRSSVSAMSGPAAAGCVRNAAANSDVECATRTGSVVAAAPAVVGDPAQRRVVVDERAVERLPGAGAEVGGEGDDRLPPSIGDAGAGLGQLGGEDPLRLRIGHGQDDGVGGLAVDARAGLDQRHQRRRAGPSRGARSATRRAQAAGRRVTPRTGRRLGKAGVGQLRETVGPAAGEPAIAPVLDLADELRIRRGEVRRADIDPAALDLRGGHPAADRLRALPHLDVVARPDQFARTRHSGDPGSDDDHLGHEVCQCCPEHRAG